MKQTKQLFTALCFLMSYALLLGFGTYVQSESPALVVEGIFSGGALILFIIGMWALEKISGSGQRVNKKEDVKSGEILAVKRKGKQPFCDDMQPFFYYSLVQDSEGNLYSLKTEEPLPVDEGEKFFKTRDGNFVPCGKNE